MEGWVAARSAVSATQASTTTGGRFGLLIGLSTAIVGTSASDASLVIAAGTSTASIDIPRTRASTLLISPKNPARRCRVCGTSSVRAR